MREMLPPKVTPLIKLVDSHSNNIIYLKDETKQHTGAFKYRGVYNKLKNIDFTQYHGVVTASTGNHGQAVSLASKQMNMICEIVLPYDTPQIKKEKIMNNGAVIHQQADLKTYDECTVFAKQIAAQKGFLYVPSFDDLDIIEGHTTLFEEASIVQFDYCFCPVGGGGLVSAALGFFNDKNTKVIGVELENNDSMKKSLASGNRINIDLGNLEGSSFCEGILVKQVGELNYKISRSNHLEIHTVRLDDIKDSIRILSKLNMKTEGAGAASLAACLKSDVRNSTVLCVISGGNIDENVFNNIIEGN